MKATVRPEYQLLAVEGEHDVHCLFEVAVPELGDDAGRPPLNIALAIDRSGSMAGAKLETARRCAAWLAERLRSEDQLAVVDFDDQARLLRPLAPVATASTAAAFAAIMPGASTNLSGGWLKALEQLRTAPDGEPRRILLLTDGMANVGITDHASLVTMSGSAAGEGVATTTIGFGDGFDEDLLTAMADAGSGGSHWAENPDAAPAIFAREFDGLTHLVAQNLSLEIRPRDDVEVLSILNEYPQVPVADGVQVQLGDAYGGEVRRVVFALHIPRIAELGAATVADLVLRYVSVADEVASHEVTLPVVVNAVSAAEAAQAGGDAAVTEQVTLLKAARARDEAIRRADEGDALGARDVLHSASLDLRAAGLVDEATALDAEVLDMGDAAPTATQRKRMRYDSYNRRRGR